MANDVKWVKLTTDMFDNRKIKHLRRLPDGNNIVLIWVMLLTMAGRCNSNGMIFLTENIPYTPKMLADELDFEENTVILALQALENLDMIMTDGKFFSIAGWEEYQNVEGMDKIREQNRLAQQRSRARRKLLQSAESESSDLSCDSHVTVTQCHDTEEEGEGDSEKEIHSFVHSAREQSPAVKESAKMRYLGGTLGKGVVMLSDDQWEDLCNKLSVEEIDKYIGIVAECELNGQRYKKKTHYQAILDMAMKDRKIK
jgi:predicted phage replisome organizer